LYLNLSCSRIYSNLSQLPSWIDILHFRQYSVSHSTHFPVVTPSFINIYPFLHYSFGQSNKFLLFYMLFLNLTNSYFYLLLFITVLKKLHPSFTAFRHSSIGHSINLKLLICSLKYNTRQFLQNKCSHWKTCLKYSSVNISAQKLHYLCSFSLFCL
jgi:hypothetical protein